MMYELPRESTSADQLRGIYRDIIDESVRSVTPTKKAAALFAKFADALQKGEYNVLRGFFQEHWPCSHCTHAQKVCLDYVVISHGISSSKLISFNDTGILRKFRFLFLP
jgi:hypothetical protein